MAKAIGYGRVSTSEQAASGLGIEAQRVAVVAAAERAELPLAAWLTDEGISGAKGLEDRPALLAAVEALGRGDVLLIAKRDRLGRDPLQLAMLERLVSRRGGRVVSAAGEGTDDDDPTSVLMRRIVDAFAEYERLVIGARTKAALGRLRASGRRAGNVPFGFCADAEGRLSEAPAEQAVIEAVMSARARGLSHRAIVAELAAAGVVSPRSGKPLAQRQVSRILETARAA